MIYNIYHSTEFLYRQWVTFSHNLVRLQPRNTPFQTLVDFSLETTPFVSEMDDYDDYFGNHLSHVLIREPHNQLQVISRSCVAMDMEALNQHQWLAQQAKNVTYAQALKTLEGHSAEGIVAKQFVLPSPLIPIAPQQLHTYALHSFSPERSLYASVEELMTRIFNDFSFIPGFTDVTTSVDEVFQKRHGVCQDFAHLAISALRSLGIPARYISGYIETIPPPGTEKLFGVDASHAWFSIFIPGFGWFDFDPTNNLLPYDQHIVLGYGRDYADIAPMQGVVLGSGKSEVKVTVDVVREGVQWTDSIE